MAGQMRSIDIFGVTLEVCTFGTGTPALLIHGVPGDLRTLAPVAELVAARHKAIVTSLPAASSEARPQRPFGTEAWAADLADVIAALGLGPVHLVAWSYSAHAALALAVRQPDLLRSLFVYEPGFPTFVEDKAVLAAVERDTVAAFGPVAEALQAGDLDEALRRSIDAAAGDPGWFDRQPEERRRVHRETAAMLPLVFRQTPPIPLEAADLAAIRCPTTVAWGEDTRDCYRLVSAAAAGAIPQARRVEVASAGHLLPEQAPERFADLVLEHVGRADR